jgi:hypothetical protein
MIEQMKIGVSFAIAGGHIAKLKEFQKSIALLDKSVIGLNEKLPILNAHFEKIGTTLTAINPKMQELFKSIQSTSRVMTSGDKKFMLYAGAMSQATTRAATLSHELNILKANMLEVSAASEGTNILGNGGKKGGRGHGGNNRLAHMLGTESGGGALGGFLTGRALGGTSTGLLLGAIGSAMLVKAGFNANAQFQQAQAQFAAQGFGAAANANATQMALSSNLPGISKIEMMSAINDAATVTRNAAQALKLAPTVATMSFANRQLYAMRGQSFTQQDEMRLLRFAELKTGTTDPNKIIPTLNLLEQGFTSEAARLRPTDLFTFSKLGAAMLSQLSDTGLAALFPLIQSLGGARAGTGLYTMQTSLMKGQNMRTGKRAVAEFQRLGIYGDNARLKPQLTSLLQSDPVAFINQVLVPAMEKKGITTTQQKIAESNVLFTQTAARVFAQVLEQEPRIAASRALVPRAAGVQTAYQTALTTPGGQLAQVSAAWSNLALAFGNLTKPAMIAGMQSLVVFLNGLAATFDAIHKIGAGTAQAIRGGIFAPVDKAKEWLLGEASSTFNTVKANAVSDQQQKDTHSSPVKTSSNQGTQNIILQIDGRTLGQIIMDQQNKMMNRQQIGLSSYSLLQNPLPVGSQYPIS